MPNVLCWCFPILTMLGRREVEAQREEEEVEVVDSPPPSKKRAAATSSLGQASDLFADDNIDEPVILSSASSKRPTATPSKGKERAIVEDDAQGDQSAPTTPSSSVRGLHDVRSRSSQRCVRAC
jgi:hypothetical protein